MAPEKKDIRHSSSLKILLIFVSTLTLFLSACEGNKTDGLLQVGDIAPDFSVTDLDGNEIRLKEWRGSLVILRFWSTDCKYCQADTPSFNDFFNSYKSKGLKIVYINSGSSLQKVRDFTRQLKIPFSVVMDERGSIGKLYRVKAVPQTIIIDPAQRIVTAVLGGVGKKELDELTAAYLL
jgi:peroxiredoxin